MDGEGDLVAELAIRDDEREKERTGEEKRWIGRGWMVKRGEEMDV